MLDGHVHTVYCGHACGTMEDYVLAAVGRGLSGIVFLEHLEVGIDYPHRTWLTPEDFVRFRNEARALRERFSGRIEVMAGIEAGWNPERGEEIAALAAGGGWDRVGLSFHFLEIGGNHYNLVSRQDFNLEAFARLGAERVLDRYFDGLEAALETVRADTLCHLDAPLRYLPGVDIEKSHGNRLLRILEKIRSLGVALEVNCSGFPLRREPFPSFSLLRTARDMGIPFTLGSDAHRPEDVGRGFDRLPEWIHANIRPGPRRKGKGRKTMPSIAP